MKTGLYDRHVALGAKIVDFAGWKMPIQFQGILREHQAVRSGAGIFDVSHMGRIEVSGPDAESLMDSLSTNKIVGRADYSAVYTVWCNKSGGSVDDLIVFRRDQNNFFVIVNASNRQKDLKHLQDVGTSFSVEIQEKYDDGILAVQGPKAQGVVSKIFSSVKGLRPMTFLIEKYKGQEVIIAGTGYTGAGGVEIFAPMGAAIELWDRLIELKVEPIGLGARDTLRLEMGYALYGHELTEEIAPTESVSAWTVKWDKNFIGKESLQKLEDHPNKRSQYGIVLTEQGIARQGYPVYKNDKKIGVVTSGTHSPSLNQAIAIGMCETLLQTGDVVQIEIRGTLKAATVVRLPFYKA